MIYKFIVPYVFLFALFCIKPPLLIAADSPAIATLSSSGWLEQRMSLNCNNRSLKEVMENIATFFQTEIVYEAEGADRPVQCQYSLKTVEQTLDRLFRKENRAILIENVPKRKITVQVFGVSEYNIVSNDGSSTIETLPFLANMTNEALVAMQSEQLNAYREEMKDLNAIVPGVGLTRAELAKLQSEQLNAYREEMNDPNAIVAGVGLTHAEIKKLHQEQIEQLKRNQNDPGQIVAGMEITQQQLKALQEHQLKQYEQEKQDQNQVDPITGLTTAQIKELHHQQVQ